MNLLVCLAFQTTQTRVYLNLVTAGELTFNLACPWGKITSTLEFYSTQLGKTNPHFAIFPGSVQCVVRVRAI